jgi:DUF1009 family protein
MEPVTAPMTKTEGAPLSCLAHGARIGIVAGGGKLPVQVAKGLSEQGFSPFIVMVEGEVDGDSGLGGYDHEKLRLEDVGSLMPMLRRHRITHLVLAGEIKRRPRLAAMRFNLGLLVILPLAVMGLARGDDGLLRIIVRGLEARGITVVGAHEVVPELVADEGPMTKAVPKKSDWRDIEAARAAAEAIGALDIGQGAVAIGGRAIALEGIEGTDGLLERVRDLRSHGRLAGKAGGVLVKCAKPGQEVRADLPSVGPQTVEAAYAAGLSGIAVEAGRSLVLEGPALVARADALGLFVFGLPKREAAHGG